MRILKIGVLVLTFLSTNLYAADKSGSFIVLSYGSSSCGTIVKEYEQNESIFFSIWVGGYLTALNEVLYTGKNVAKGTDPNARDLWIYNYCKKNPLKNLHDATSSLYLALLKK